MGDGALPRTAAEAGGLVVTQLLTDNLVAKPCVTCHGSGEIAVAPKTLGAQRTCMTCPTCEGSGREYMHDDSVVAITRTEAESLGLHLLEIESPKSETVMPWSTN